MTKKALRQAYRQKRNELEEKERLRLDDLLLIQFQRINVPDKLTVLLSYWPLEQHTEVNTHLMTRFLQFRIPTLQVAYPVTDFTNLSLKLMRVNEDTVYTVNEYGIAEPVDGEEIAPEQVDMVFVPLLIFDRKGNRVGYGKGFYDRFLAQCRTDIIKAGFSFFEPVERIDDISQFDIPLSIGITPNAIYEF